MLKKNYFILNRRFIYIYILMLSIKKTNVNTLYVPNVSENERNVNAVS